MEESKESYLEKILDKATALGASYADARCQRFDDELITVENKELKSYSSRRLSGIGIRIVLKGAMDYASTSDLSQSARVAMSPAYSFFFLFLMQDLLLLLLKRHIWGIQCGWDLV
jgi:predicted Zn-dependent protease